MEKDTEQKPFAGFDDFDSCVNTMMQDEDYDEESAKKICGALQEEYEENGKQEANKLKNELLNNADAMIDQLELGTFSFVGNPAQPSEFVLFKDNDKRWEWKSSNTLVKSPDDDWNIVYGAVMIPGITDKQGDVITNKAIRDSAHEFLESGKVNSIDSDHDLIIDKGTLVESWLLKEDKEYEKPDGGKIEYPKGTWMVGVRPKDDIKERIEEGDITGFSIYGESTKYPLKSMDDNPSSEKNIKDKNNIDNNNIQDDNMDKEEIEELFDDFETSIKESIDFSETLNELKETVNQLNEQLKSEEPEEEAQEESEEQEKQEVDNLADAIEWLDANAPEDVLALIQDAIQTEEAEEDEDDDEDENKEQEAKEKADNTPIDDDEEDEDVIKSNSFNEIANQYKKDLNKVGE